MMIMTMMGIHVVINTAELHTIHTPSIMGRREQKKMHQRNVGLKAMCPRSPWLYLSTDSVLIPCLGPTADR
jgi:hypothetical protein